MMRTFPEVNGMNEKEVEAALKLGYVNLRSITPAARKGLEERLEAMEERLRRLRATAERSQGPWQPYNFEAPDWGPLERAVKLAGLPEEVCGEFMWMCEEVPGVQSYKHRDTRSYVRLTSTTSAPACERDLKAARRVA
jgi:hypothetical protein